MSVRVIEIKKHIFENNDKEADRIRKRLKFEKTFLLNLMSSPGAGKTTLLVRTIEMLKNEMKIGVMEADIDSSVDAEKIAETGVKSIQLHTGGMCHLDAVMTEQGLDEVGTRELDFVVLENIGNLICPAEFDTGASRNAMILSVPEGDDKPLKYPVIFRKVDVLVISKIDCLPYFDFDIQAVYKSARKLNPLIEIFEVSAKTGEGISSWVDWIKRNVKEWCKE